MIFGELRAGLLGGKTTKIAAKENKEKEEVKSGQKSDQPAPKGSKEKNG